MKDNNISFLEVRGINGNETLEVNPFTLKAIQSLSMEMTDENTRKKTKKVS